jgi:hypothetical protein
MRKAKKVSRNEFIAFINTLGKWTEAVEIHQKFLLLEDQKVRGFM